LLEELGDRVRFEPDAIPAVDQGAEWPRGRPLGFHRFVIAAADETSFRLEAVDYRGRVTFRITESDEDAKRLLPVFCVWEKRPQEQEPAAFFQRARRRLRWFHEVPKTWSDLGIHWSREDHFRQVYNFDGTRGRDPRALPKPEDGNRWRPRGSKYTYELSAVDDDPETYIIRTYNTAGLPNYIVVGSDGDPQEIAE
jgi:hypothetical protein